MLKNAREGRKGEKRRRSKRWGEGVKREGKEAVRKKADLGGSCREGWRCGRNKKNRRWEEGKVSKRGVKRGRRKKRRTKAGR